MQQSQLNRIMKLIKKTGDKMAILDNETDSALMVMELEAYEKMLEHPAAEIQNIEQLTEEELMEKINKDVAVWRAYNDKEHLEQLDLEEVVDKKGTVQSASGMSEKRPIVAKNIPMADENRFAAQTTAVGLEDSAADIASEEDEEKFYLEPVE